MKSGESGEAKYCARYKYPYIRIFSEDPSDNLFINLAIDGNAKTIVSGDSHLLRFKEYKGIEIISVSEFLEYYA